MVGDMRRVSRETERERERDREIGNKYDLVPSLVHGTRTIS